jgi:HSP20 family protein
MIMTSHQDKRQGHGESTMVRSSQGETSLANRQYQDSFSLLDAMFERMQRDFFGTSLFNALLPTRSGNGEREAPRLPRTQLRDAGDAIEVTAELPGIKPEDVKVELDDDVLTIRGETAVEEETDGERVERYISFLRQLELPEEVDAEQVRASYNNGMLTIRIPKRTHRENVRQIPIDTQSSDQHPTSGQQQGQQQSGEQQKGEQRKGRAA